MLIPQSSLGWTLQLWTRQLIMQKCSKCLERTQACQLSAMKVAVTNTGVCQKSLASSKSLSFVCIANLPETETARRDTKAFCELSFTLLLLGSAGQQPSEKVLGDCMVIRLRQKETV